MYVSLQNNCQLQSVLILFYFENFGPANQWRREVRLSSRRAGLDPCGIKAVPRSVVRDHAGLVLRGPIKHCDDEKTRLLKQGDGTGGECFGNSMGCIDGIQFGAGIFEMEFHRALADIHDMRNIPIGFTGGAPAQTFLLAL